jgi:hypothetical protein
MSSKTILAALALSLTSFAVSACAPNLCQRKHDWFASHCAGTDVSYSRDSTCEAAIDHCDQGHLAQLQSYVMCLESQNMCSMDTIAACGQQYPGGVNLMCTPTN